MSKLNAKSGGDLKRRTYEGASGGNLSPVEILRRSVMSCLLWEGEFYESGTTISKRISSLISLVAPEEAMAIADEARNKMNVRHVPLLIAREMARLPKHKAFVAETLKKIIRRPDEMTEFLALYWKDGRQPLSSQVKKGLASVFGSFDEYQMAKYNRRKDSVSFRDLMFLVHPKPEGNEKEDLFRRLAADELQTPDTWETALSRGDDKKATWTRLLLEGKLGDLALLRNLRNMLSVGVDIGIIKSALKKIHSEKILPFRFISAVACAPELKSELEEAMLSSLAEFKKLKGLTAMMVDVSGSMFSYLSTGSAMSRMDAANALAIMIREICENAYIFTFSDRLASIPQNIRGFELISAIGASQKNSGTYLGLAVKTVNDMENYDRIIVITDEQSADPIPSPKTRGYMINLASCEYGIGYGPWIHIDGWSSAVVQYISEYEKTF